MRFHSPIKYPWTLTLFALFTFFWLGKEIAYHQRHAPKPVFENAGKGSYSIYLVHLLGPAIYTYLSLPLLAPILQWFVLVPVTLLFCYLFFRLVEKPSHALARTLGDRLAPRSASLPP